MHVPLFKHGLLGVVSQFLGNGQLVGFGSGDTITDPLVMPYRCKMIYHEQQGNNNIAVRKMINAVYVTQRYKMSEAMKI